MTLETSISRGAEKNRMGFTGFWTEPPPQQPRTHVPVAEPEAWDIAELVEMGLSENSVPLKPVVNDHYPY